MEKTLMFKVVPSLLLMLLARSGERDEAVIVD